MRRRARVALLPALLLALVWSPAFAGDPAPPSLPETAPGSAAAAVAPVASIPATRSGLDIYARFREGLADPSCPQDSSSQRWRKHFAAAPQRLAREDDDALALFGYVVDALREASLPTEYALIPFVESGYKPGARSRGGPAGMWQMIRITARQHDVPMRDGYDGRLSPVDSTRAAVRYLKTLHGMFAGDWRLAVMAYNAGEYRVFGALRRSGQVARSADPEKLASLSGITRAYVRKLHALSCLLDRADEREQWLQSLDRQVPVLEVVVLPPDARDLQAWARAHGRDAEAVRRLNPAFAGGRIQRAGPAQRVLAPMRASPPPLAVHGWPGKRGAGKLAATLTHRTTHGLDDTMGFLQGKRALVTGIASQRSIANGIAEAMHREGAELALTYQNDKLKSRVEDAAAGFGSKIVLPLDVADDAQIEACFAELGKHWDGFDILVHCIAYAPREAIGGDFLDGISRENFAIAQDISAYSLAALAKAARPQMKGRNGAVLTLTYLGAVRALQNYNVMGVAKASLESTVRYLALNLGPEGTRVNAISAGPIKTLAASGVGNFRKMLSQFEAAAPLRRNVTIEDVGNAAAFLCSDLASGITGEVTYVDAGFSIVGMTGIE